MNWKLLAIALLGLTCLMPLAQAQRGGARFSAGPHFGIQAAPRFSGVRSARFVRPYAASSLFLGEPSLFDYGSSQPYAVQTSPQMIVVPAASAAPPEIQPARAEPLLIEWRGDRYVRVANTSSQAPLDYVASPASATGAAHTNVPALLVFRDGTRLEVSNYTITGSTLYTDADRWVSGSWRRKIDLAALDVPSTLHANQERGVAFNLPSSPNEVIVRP